MNNQQMTDHVDYTVSHFFTEEIEAIKAIFYFTDGSRQVKTITREMLDARHISNLSPVWLSDISEDDNESENEAEVSDENPS
jgi:hypothetical protein